jgi:hypothetical protein
LLCANNRPAWAAHTFFPARRRQESIASLYAAVATCMRPDLAFELYTTPPRVTLDRAAGTTLAEARLVPAAAIRLSVRDSGSGSSEPGDSDAVPEAPDAVAADLALLAPEIAAAGVHSFDEMVPRRAAAAAAAGAGAGGAGGGAPADAARPKAGGAGKGGAQFLRLAKPHK